MAKRCYHSVKDNKSESKSQPRLERLTVRPCCYHSVKDNKSESKSQQSFARHADSAGCYHSVKDNKSESKSQPLPVNPATAIVVIILSKIINLKANHNSMKQTINFSAVVIILSKIINLKANHNLSLFP